MLLDEGADPKTQDNDGSNALHKVMHSIDNGELFLENIYRKSRLLIAASSNVNQCDIWGRRLPMMLCHLVAGMNGAQH